MNEWMKFKCTYTKEEICAMATNKAKYKAHSFRKLLNQYVCVHVFSEIPVRCPQTLSLSLSSLYINVL